MHLSALQIVAIAAGIFEVPALWMIARRAGLPRWGSFAALLGPLGLVAMLYYIALEDWHPKQDEAEIPLSHQAE
jgi:hypothetical protein